MSDASTRLPNLYVLLALSPLESDGDKIDAAVKRLLGRLPNIDVAEQSPARTLEAERIQKLAALAQKYLLDPKRKAAYDQQWIAVYRPAAGDQAQVPASPLSTAPVAIQSAASASQAAMAEAATAQAATAQAATAQAATAQAGKASVPRATTARPAQRAAARAPTRATSQVDGKIVTAKAAAWDVRRLDALLPQGDPQTPFDMAAFLRTSESRDPLAAEADLNKLIALLSNTANAEVAPAKESAYVSEAEQPLVSDVVGLSLSQRAEGNSRASLAPTAVLAKRLQRKKQRALIIGGGLFALGSVGLVLLGVFIFGGESSEESRRQLAQQRSSRPAPRQGSGLPKIDLGSAIVGEAAQSDDAPLQPPVSSGLPQPGQANATLEIDATAANPANEPMLTKATTVPASPTREAPAPVTPAVDTPAPVTPAPVTPAVDTPAPVMPAPAAPMVDAALTKEDKVAWRSGMNEVRGLIGQHDFALAEKKMAELKESAKTGLQREQLERLTQVHGFVRDIRQAMVDAITGLAAADTFKIGKSTMASFIEGDTSGIKLRVSGETRDYKLEAMPVPVGLALVDLKLDVAHASTLARKGAYIVMHPKNQLTLAQGKQMLRDAAAAGAITLELAQFYEDDYGLSQLGN